MYVPLQVPNKKFKLFGVSSETIKKSKFKWHSSSEAQKPAQQKDGLKQRVL